MNEPTKTPDLTVPRCGTCGGPCDPQRSDEGYSLCCDDRIEYPDEYLQDNHIRGLLGLKPIEYR